MVKSCNLDKTIENRSIGLYGFKSQSLLNSTANEFNLIYLILSLIYTPLIKEMNIAHFPKLSAIKHIIHYFLSFNSFKNCILRIILCTEEMQSKSSLAAFLDLNEKLIELYSSLLQRI